MWLALPRVARLLGLSARTLTRRLRSQATSYQVVHGIEGFIVQHDLRSARSGQLRAGVPEVHVWRDGDDRRVGAPAQFVITRVLDQVRRSGRDSSRTYGREQTMVGTGWS